MIKASPTACESCPLAEVKEPDEEPPSEYLQHLLYVDGLIQAGAHFLYDDIPAADWRALGVLKRKRDEKQIKDMKAKNKTRT